MTDKPDDSARPDDAAGPPDADEFLAAADASQRGLAGEFWDFLRENKKWWLAPLLIAFAIVGALLVFGSSTAGPFVYTLF